MTRKLVIQNKEYNHHKPTEVWSNGDLVWCKDGELHRELDLPAVIVRDGTLAWFLDGMRHRVDGPAIILVYKNKVSNFWFYKGMRHRVDGPAFEYYDGSHEWFINDVDLTSEIKTWLLENNIAYPFSKENEILFRLRWG